MLKFAERLVSLSKKFGSENRCVSPIFRNFRDQIPSRLKPCSASTPTATPPTRGRPRLHIAPDPPPPPPPPSRERRRVRFDLTPQPAAADSGTVFPAQPCRFFERPEEATKSRYPRRQRGPPPDLAYSFLPAHRDQEAGGTYVESRTSLRSAPRPVYQRNQF